MAAHLDRYPVELAVSTGQLIAARGALGLGAAVLMPLTSAVLTVIFDPAERPKALTIWVTASALGTGLRLLPVIGGLLVGARVAGRLEPRRGAKTVVTAGLLLTRRDA